MTRKYYSVWKMGVIILILITSVLTGSGTEMKPEIGYRHTIILVDATRHFSAYVGEGYPDKIKRCRDMIVAAFEGKSSSPNKVKNSNDLVSLVFFFYPLKPYRGVSKISGEKYFYTPEQLIFTREDFTNDKKGEFSLTGYIGTVINSFTRNSYSAIELSVHSVIPFLNRKLSESNRMGAFNDKWVEGISLILISNQSDSFSGFTTKGFEVELRSFLDKIDERSFEKYTKAFTQNFELKNDSPDTSREPVLNCRRKGRDEMPFYAYYYLVSPKLPASVTIENENETIDLSKTAEFVRQGINGNKDILMFWKGTHVIKFKIKKMEGINSEFSYRLEWKGKTGNNPDDWWKSPAENNDIGKIVSLERKNDDNYQYTIRIPVKGENKILKEKKLAFRGCIELLCPSGDNKGANGYLYPFKFRFYTRKKEITFRRDKTESSGKCPFYKYVGGESVEELEVSEIILKKYLESVISEKFLGLNSEDSKAVINRVNVNVDDGLSICEASDISREITQIKVAKYKSRMKKIVIFLVSLALMLVVIIITFIVFMRNPIIKAVFLPALRNNLNFDFSNPIEKPQQVATFQLRNQKTSLAKVQAKKRFNLSLNLGFSYSNPKDNELQGDESRFLSVKRESTKEEYSLEKTNDGFKLELKNVCAGETFSVLFNFFEVKDIYGRETDAKEITFHLNLTDIEGTFIKGDKPVAIETKPEELKTIFMVKFIPEHRQKEEEERFITIDAVDSKETLLTPNPGSNHYKLEFSARKPSIRKLFDITVSNPNKLQFSTPFKGEFFIEAEENNTQHKPGHIFHLGTEQAFGDPLLKSMYKVDLEREKDAKFHLYIDYGQLGGNPLEDRKFRLQLKMKRDNKKDISLLDDYIKLDVGRSREKTEPLIQIADAQDAAKFLEYGDRLKDGYLVLDESLRDIDEFRVEFPENPEKPIHEYDRSKLFTLKLGNSCNTGTGYYEFKVENPKLVPNDCITLGNKKKKRKKGEAITLRPSRASGRVEDRDYEDGFREVDFYVNHDCIKILKYVVSFDVMFTLALRFYERQDDKKASFSKEYQITAVVKGFHDVRPNYLVIDFGTSAIAAGKSDSNPKRKPVGHIEFEEDRKLRDRLMKIEEGFLPSVISIAHKSDDKPGPEKLGSKEFVYLPAFSSFLHIKPQLLLTAVKLWILNGRKEVELPDDFEYLDENGEGETGGEVPLKSVLKSIYRNLKSNYIDKKEKDYKKLVITHPNIYNNSHKKFLKDIITSVFINPDDGVYEENIELVSESDAVLFHFLKYQADTKPGERKKNIIIFDIGGGTLDITYAGVEWNSDLPEKVTIYKRDGIILGGDVLDKAITLQVHTILEHNTKKIDVSATKMIVPDETSDAKFLDEELILREREKQDKMNRDKINETTGTGSAMQEESPPAPPADLYKAKIIGGRQTNSKKFIDLLLEFKYKYILQFKNEMGRAAKDYDRVGICLGDNDSEGTTGDKKGFCNIGSNTSAPIEVPTGINLEKKVEGEIKKRNDRLYLELKKAEWLELPYLLRFKEILKKKIEEFKQSAGIIEGNTGIILSGRTSLWPSVKEAVQEVFTVDNESEPRENNIEIIDSIWAKEKNKQSINLKRAVTDGALHRHKTWPHIECESPVSHGVPAIRYQKKAVYDSPEALDVKVLVPGNPPEEIPLDHASEFEVGLKTVIDFVPFVGGAKYLTRNFCRKMNKIKVEVRENFERSGYDFLISSDKYEKRPLKLSMETDSDTKYIEFKGSKWPIPDELEEVAPGEFNEEV